MSSPSDLRSWLYQGVVTHARPGPDGHRFSQKVQMALIDLDEIDALCGLHPLWSSSHRAPAELRRADYLGDASTPLPAAVRDEVERQIGERPSGPISLLTNVRLWGWLANPISCYFCFDPSGTEVRFMLAEVTNTPWHERHRYVVGGPGDHEFSKQLHVSPFLAMDQRYLLRYSAPGATLDLSIEVRAPDGPSLFAGIELQRVRATRRALGQMLWAPQQSAPGVSWGIYRQALSLLVKGARLHRHPRATSARHLQEDSVDA